LIGHKYYVDFYFIYFYFCW